MVLRGRLAVVTGASSGIGAATARALGREGARVVLMARGADALEREAQAVRDAGGEAHPLCVDVGDHEAVAAAAERVLEGLGVPDVIVNNAGAGRFLFIDETDAEELVQMTAVPYFAAFFVTRAFIEPMLARGTGTILMVNTPASVIPWPGALGYASARFALRGFTQALRQDLRGTGLQVSSVTPGKVTSSYFERNPGAEDRIPSVERLVPALSPEQVADHIVRALRRDAKDVYVPFALRATMLFARLAPGALMWANARTGARRPAS